MSAKPNTSAFHTAKPLRLTIPHVLDIVLIADAEQIRWLNEHSNLVRPIDPSRSWLHRFLDRRLRGDLSVDGEHLPVFEPREDERRAQRQKALFTEFENLRGLPGVERDAIADYVAGRKQSPEIGVVVQQWCGRLFSDRFRSTDETYAAGSLLAGWASAPPWQTVKDRWTGRLAHAKAVLSTAAGGDKHCLHGASIGMENVARTVRKLRKAAQSEEKQLLPADEILRECLVVPPLLLRGCSDVVVAPFLDRPLTPQSLVVFLVARAYSLSGDLDVAFLSNTWSACPARRVIPDMLRVVWRAAHQDEAEVKRLLSINSWSRLWHRAVS